MACAGTAASTEPVCVPMSENAAIGLSDAIFT